MMRFPIFHLRLVPYKTPAPHCGRLLGQDEDYRPYPLVEQVFPFQKGLLPLPLSPLVSLLTVCEIPVPLPGRFIFRVFVLPRLLAPFPYFLMILSPPVSFFFWSRLILLEFRLGAEFPLPSDNLFSFIYRALAFFLSTPIFHRSVPCANPFCPVLLLPLLPIDLPSIPIRREPDIVVLAKSPSFLRCSIAYSPRQSWFYLSPAPKPLLIQPRPPSSYRLRESI